MTITRGGAPGLVHRFTIRAEVAPDRVIGPVGDGDLVYIAITGGTVVGEALNGRVLPGGGDWAVLKDDGTLTVEARYQIQTDAGDVVDILNTGVAHWEDEAEQTIGYFATRPVFRVGNPALSHLADRVYLGWARSTVDWTEIDIYEVLSPPVDAAD